MRLRSDCRRVQDSASTPGCRRCTIIRQPVRWDAFPDLCGLRVLQLWPKLFSTIEGGALAFRSASASRIEALRWYGIRRENRDALRFWEYEVTELGYRFTSNNVFAAVGMSMLP